MKLNPIKPYHINFCTKKSEPKFDNAHSTPAQFLNLEEQKIIERYIKLKNGNFSRKLTDEEAWLLARPWSIPYADFCECFEDNGYKGLYLEKEIILAEIEAREKFKTRFFNDVEIQAFITLADETDFKSASQIMRYIRLMAKDNGLVLSPTPLEAEYFAKKCTPYNEIQKYFMDKKNNPQISAISEKYDFSSFSLRKNQLDDSEIISLKAEKDGEKRYFTFVDGKLTCASKSNIEGISATNYDTSKRTTSIRTIETNPTVLTKDIIEILNDENGEPNQIYRTYFDEDYIAHTKIYKLTDYPQDLDILGLVKKDSIKPTSSTTFKTKTPDGILTVEQKYKTKNATFDRKYTVGEVFWSLKLEIKDKNGNILHKSERKFEKIDDNSTLTTLNGKKFLAIVDENDEAIVITSDNKEFWILGLIDNSIYFDNESDEENKTAKKLWHFCKTKLPADLMIIVKKLQTSLIPIENEYDSGFDNSFFGGGIYTAGNLGILAHEMGHLLSANNQDISSEYACNNPLISQNETLKEIYKKELDEFNKIHSEFVSKNTIRYFSELGGAKDRQEENETTSARSKKNKEYLNQSNGLEELVAETMYIKTAPSANNPLMAIRTHYLMMNFPLTIAYIANKIDENCKNIL